MHLLTRYLLTQFTRYFCTITLGFVSVYLLIDFFEKVDEFTEAGKSPDGTKNKFHRAMKDFARTGYIGLQDHGTPVWYRNITIQTLP